MEFRGVPSSFSGRFARPRDDPLAPRPSRRRRAPIRSAPLPELLYAITRGSASYLALAVAESENTEAASRYFERYTDKFPDDYPEPCVSSFGWALCLTLEGDESEARDKYPQRMLRNLLHRANASRRARALARCELNDRAEPTYAAEFIDSYAVLWDRETGASQYYAGEAWQDLRPPHVLEIVALRERMADFQDRFKQDYKRLWQQLMRSERLVRADAKLFKEIIGDRVDWAIVLR